MSSVLVTGGTGYIGRALIDRLIAQGNKVYVVARHWPVPGLVGVRGDILEPDLGIDFTRLRSLMDDELTAIYHLAGVVNLGPDKNGSIWETNVTGTRNCLDFAARYGIPHFFYCSTAYTQGRNAYECSKRLCELMVKESDIPHKTIFKPSIVMPSPGIITQQHFMQYVMLLIRLHGRAEMLRRKIEGTLRLPVLTPVFRIRGKSDGVINFVTLDAVASAMAAIKEEGTYWLTNPHPPKVKEITDWVGDFIMVRLEAHENFIPTPLEAMLQRMTKAFSLYLEGEDNLPSDIPPCPITREYIQSIIKTTLRSNHPCARG